MHGLRHAAFAVAGLPLLGHLLLGVAGACLATQGLAAEGLAIERADGAPLTARPATGVAAGMTADWTRERKSRALNLGLLAGVTTYGLIFWDWGESNFQSRHEGWFGMNTRSGGADKLGHAYTGAVATAIGASLYRHWGHDEAQAARFGAFSSLLLTTAVEVGDGFSPDHGFSWEDQLANLAGAGLEYLRQRHPAWRERVQFRWEYWPSPAVRHGEHRDLLTDYSGSRWLLAFPLRAWGAADNRLLKWIELQAGYGSRGFAGHDEPYFDARSRHPFIGVGIHVPLVLERLGASPGTQRLFEYLQIPGTALPLPP